VRGVSAHVAHVAHRRSVEHTETIVAARMVVGTREVDAISARIVLERAVEDTRTVLAAEIVAVAQAALIDARRAKWMAEAVDAAASITIAYAAPIVLCRAVDCAGAVEAEIVAVANRALIVLRRAMRHAVAIQTRHAVTAAHVA